MFLKAERDLIEFLEKSKNNQFDYEQHRHEEEIKFKFNEIEELLKLRVKSIVTTIDEHLLFLHGQKNMKFFDGMNVL